MFVLFLSYVIGLLGALFHPLFLLLLLLPFCYLLARKERKKFLFLLSAVPGFLLASFLPRGDSQATYLTGLVIARRSSYYLLLTGSGKYLVYDTEGSVPLFSFLSLEGKTEPLLSRHYESGFRFDEYLKSQGVFLQFVAKKTDLRFRPFNLGSFFRKRAFAQLSEEGKILASSLLCGESFSSSERFSSLVSLGLTSSLSLSGVQMGVLVRSLQACFGRRYPKLSFGVPCFLLVLLLLLSGFRYTVRRILLFFLFRALRKRLPWRLSPLEELSLLSGVLLVLEPFSILSPSFYYPFPFLFLNRVFPFRKEEARGSFFLRLTLFFLPYRLCAEGGISLLSPLLQFLLLPGFSLLFLSSFLLFPFPSFGLAFSFLSERLLRFSESAERISPFLATGSPSFLFLALYYALFLLSLTLRTYFKPKEERKVQAALAFLLFFSLLPRPFPSTGSLSSTLGRETARWSRAGGRTSLSTPGAWSEKTLPRTAWFPSSTGTRSRVSMPSSSPTKTTTIAVPWNPSPPFSPSATSTGRRTSSRTEATRLR